MKDIGGKLKNKIMRTFAFILLMVSFNSCMDVFYTGDRSIPIKINGHDSLTISSECGVVDLVSSQSQNNIEESPNKYTIYLKHCFNTMSNNYMLYTDSFKVKKEGDDSKIDNISFMHRGIDQSSRQTREIKQSIYQVNTNEIVFISFDVYFSKDWGNKLIIFPSNYIICNGKPLITDTIKIELTQ